MALDCFLFAIHSVFRLPGKQAGHNLLGWTVQWLHGLCLDGFAAERGQASGPARAISLLININGKCGQGKYIYLCIIY